MNVTLTVNNLLERKEALEKEIEADKEEIKSINIKLRKLATLLKKADLIANGPTEENTTTESSDDTEGEEVRGEAGA